MPLSLNTSQALRTHSELIQLVEAVRDAEPSEPETDSLEWKSNWRLQDADMRFQTAKHLLGFGNRGSSIAKMQFDGCAYFLAGVEPGNLVGTEVVDPAQLEDQLGRYIAPGEPRWSPNYLSINGKSVLILTIEAPRDGDPIFTLQKGFNQISAGRIYIRRHGKTTEASPADVRLLEARSGSKTEKVNLEVTACDSDAELQPLRFSTEDRNDWLKNERSRLAPPAPRGSSPYEIPLPESFEDSRGRGGFQRAVSAYLSQAEMRWYGLVVEAGVKAGHAAVKLQVENATERNFQGVEIVVEIPNIPYAWLDETEVLKVIGAPDPPKPWGSQSIVDSIRVDPLPLPIGSLSSDTVEKDGVIRVRFDSRHLRPGETLKLPDIHLTLSASRAGEEISLHWRLTAMDADGWREGDLAVRIGNDPLTPELAPESTKQS